MRKILNVLQSLHVFSILFFCLFFPFFMKGTEIASPSNNNTLLFSLDEAVMCALEHNEAIIAERGVVKEAEAGVMIARAGFLPKISAQGSYTRLAEVPAFEMPGPGFIPVYGDYMGYPDTTNIIGWTIGSVDTVNTIAFSMGETENYLARATLTQPLFTWGKILNGYQIAGLNLKAVKENYRKKKNELVFNVTKSFYGIFVLEELSKVTEDAYEQTKRHVDVVEKRYNAGLASDFDLLRAQVQLKNMEPQLIKVGNGLEMAEKGFKTILGLPQERVTELKGELKYEPFEVDVESLINEAITNRPEIKSLSLRKQMAEKVLSLTKRANLPDVALIANYDYKKPLYFENEWGTDWNVTIVARMPIFTGLENLGKNKQARERVREVRHYLGMLENMVELEVRSVCLKLKEAEKLVESQKENVTQAEKALAIVEKRYELGLATSLEAMDTQLAVTMAKTNYLRALSDYVIAEAELEKVVGK